MIDYEKYEVQSSDCYLCRCKNCHENDICKNGCKFCIKKGFTNRKKECFYQGMADKADEVTDQLQHEASLKLNESQAYYKGYVQACEDFGRMMREAAMRYSNRNTRE